MLTIRLSGLQFHSYHGVYEEESITGSDYEVDVMINFLPGNSVITHLSETVDYVMMYNMVKDNMSKPEKLLETVAMQTAHALLSADKKIDEVWVKIKKLNAPIAFFNGNVSAEYNLQRTSLK